LGKKKQQRCRKIKCQRGTKSLVKRRRKKNNHSESEDPSHWATEGKKRKGRSGKRFGGEFSN